MQLEHKTVEINAGEFVVILKTNHRPIAVGSQSSSFEPNTTVNTGNTENEFTVREPR
jgi:predicted ribosome-associated RNA-binding protein Tma20